ncbi:bifunctional 2-polyprenyl-6-hydroxyphenol methylase/3-demethylubiquinol 3-O-methyltransferase UbiG [Achromobacter sp. JUb104]|uniref:class I SAM-dependent methyltransferase n=1 Tax=Achromobacter sp. JUb104 TaxID=2940590 RepID=UPI002168C1DC|nr:class I SAM-dependent methyltransferase [Achromobacter sp. JUb104]MCS3505843.1 SAM-dependent methyltransferase [Achromobacter sp. JUb104]
MRKNRQNRSPFHAGAKGPAVIERASLTSNDTAQAQEELLAGDAIFSRCLTQWQFGEWEKLVQVSLEDLRPLRTRAILALLVGAAHQQLANFESAKSLFLEARVWGCTMQQVARIAVASLQSTLARAAMLLGDSKKAAVYLEAALDVAGLGDTGLLLPVRLQVEASRLKARFRERSNSEAVSVTPVEAAGVVKTFPAVFSCDVEIDSEKFSGCFNSDSRGEFERAGAVLRYKTEAAIPIYFTTSAAGSLDHPMEAQFPLEGNREYVIDGFISNSGGHNPIIWIFEYKNGKRIASRHMIPNFGSFFLRFTSNAGADSFAVGIRLMGTGELNLHHTKFKVIRSTLPIANIGASWVREVCEQEYKSQVFSRFNERAVEFAFLFAVIAKYYPKRILDVGTGTTALPHLMRNSGPLVTAIDNIKDYWAEDIVNRHYHVVNDDITQAKTSDQFDLVTCISVLEHIEECDKAVESMSGLMARNGLLVMTFPYNENRYVDNVYKLPGSAYGQTAKYVTQAYCRADINRWLSRFGLEILEQDYWDYWTGDCWTVGQQIIPPVKVSQDKKHQLTCLLLRKKA